MRERFSALVAYISLIFAVSICAEALPQSALPATLDEAVRLSRVEELTAGVASLPPGIEHDYFAGIIANFNGRFAESIELLNAILPKLHTTQPKRAALALSYLADDYNELFRYTESSDAYNRLITNYAKLFPDVVLQGTRDNAKVAQILRGAPPQTIKWKGSVDLDASRNPLGSLNVSLTANSVAEQWLIDTGANVSVVSASFAARLGLTPLVGEAQTQGSTGFENKLKVAILPEMHIGEATVTNIVLLILDDANLNMKLPDANYQIEAVLGYPVLRALGVVTLRRDGHFEARNPAEHLTGGAKLYMSGATPAVMCRVEGKNLLFTLDTGASDTVLSSDYYTIFRGERKKWRKAQYKGFGAGGGVQRNIYLQPRLTLGVGEKQAIITNVNVPASGGNPTGFYGNLGEDFLGGFDSYTIDFTNMTLSLGQPITPSSTSSR